MLRQIRHSVLALVQRPVGRLGALLIVAALVSAGIPGGDLHAHADGYDSHEHAASLTDDHAPDQHDHTNAAEPDGAEVLHAHDVCVCVSSLPPVPAMVPESGDFVVARVRPVVALAPLTTKAPPYRPPIA